MRRSRRCAPEHVRQFVAAAREVYYAPGDVVLEPAMGPPTGLHLLRQGHITGRRGIAALAGGLQYEAGDLFPVGAVLGARPVTSTYTASDDCFCLLLPAAAVKPLAAASPPFADFLERRGLQFFELSRQAMRESYASAGAGRSSRSRRAWRPCRASSRWRAHPTRRWPRRWRRCTTGASARCWSWTGRARPAAS